MSRLKIALMLCLLLQAGGTLSAARRVPQNIRRNFTNCYRANPVTPTGISFGGIYRMTKTGQFSSGYGKHMRASTSHVTRFIFYEDGTFLYNIIDPSLCAPDTAQAALPESRAYFGDWGIYRIQDSTVIAQYMNKPQSGVPWYAFELRFRINSDSTLSHMGMRSLEKADQDYFFPEGVTFLPARFSPCAVPEPASWLKQQSWTHCR